jgi:hypothetical protein
MEAIRHHRHIKTAKENYASHYKKMLNTLSVSQRANLGNIDSLAQEQASQLEQAYSSPQMQSLLFYDPTIDLEQLEIPVLVLFGGKDTQVTETLNRQPIKRALERSESRYEIELFSNANHLFQKANTPEAILELGRDGVKDCIQTIGLYNSKADNVIQTCALLCERHQGQIPRTRDALEALPGVGRKTANVVLNTAFGEPTMAVDTHIFRVLDNDIGFFLGG